MYLLLQKHKLRFFFSNDMILSTILRLIFFYVPAVIIGVVSGMIMKLTSASDLVAVHQLGAFCFFLSCLFHKVNVGYSLKKFLLLPVSRNIIKYDIIISFILKPLNILLLLAGTVAIAASTMMTFHKVLALLYFLLFVLFIGYWFINLKVGLVELKKNTLNHAFITAVLYTALLLMIPGTATEYLFSALTAVHFFYLYVFNKKISDKLFYVSNL